MKRTLATLALLCAVAAIASFMLTGCAAVTRGMLEAHCAADKATYGKENCLW